MGGEEATSSSKYFRSLVSVEGGLGGGRFVEERRKERCLRKGIGGRGIQRIKEREIRGR